MSKYGNKKTVIDGIKFDSLAEGRRYLYLKRLEELGEITNLRLQPKFNYYAENEKTQKGKPKVLFFYKADFDYCTDDGKYVIEDVKGIKTQIFKLKKRLIEDRFGYEITEIY